jgi:hypothetical protein
VAGIGGCIELGEGGLTGDGGGGERRKVDYRLRLSMSTAVSYR